MSTQDPTPPGDRPYGQPPEAPRFGSGAPAGEPPAAPPYGQQEPYGQPAPYSGGASPAGGGYGAEQPRNGIGLAALIVGIVSLLAAIIPFVGFIGIAAIVLGAIGLSRVRKRIATNRGMAIAGIVLGALAIIGAIIWVVLTVLFAGTFGSAVTECSQLEPNSVEQQQCIEENVAEELGQ